MAYGSTAKILRVNLSTNTLEVETLSELYLRTLQAGQPVLLSAQEFQDAQSRFAGYGKAAESKETGAE